MLVFNKYFYKKKSKLYFEDLSEYADPPAGGGVLSGFGVF
jgi:hypothetical protein